MPKVYSVQSVYSDLCRDLARDVRTIDSITTTYKALHSNSERIRFVRDVLKDYRYLPIVVQGGKKDVERSRNCRLEGNKFFVAKNDYEALKKYNESIMYAVEDEELAMAYANRSAVCLKKELYDECLKDIELALKSNYPQNLIAKLKNRQQKAHELQKQSPNKEKYYLDPPQISSGPNTYFECASDSIEMKFNELEGRHIVATREIKAGDVIAVEKPFIAVLLKNSFATHCANCLELAYNLIPCAHCPLALYCGELCRDKSWSAHHRFECQLMVTLSMLDATDVQLLALRLVILLRDKLKDIQRVNPVITDESYKSDRYEEIHNLVTNESSRTISYLFSRSTMACTLLNLLENTDYFDIFGEDVEEMKNFAGGLILHYIQTASTNMHAINELFGGENTDCIQREVGAGAYSFLSLLNHSCAPNVVRNYYGTTAVLRAISTIRPGEQILDNYGYHFAVMDRKTRQEDLKWQYCFDCECKACRENWPLYVDIPEDKETYLKGNELKYGNRECASEIIDELHCIMSSLDGSALSRHVCNIQEYIKQCYAIFGNKHNIL